MALDEAGLEDSAILLMSLGEEEAAAVFRHLSPREVQSLGATIARMTSVPKERLDKRAGQVHDASPRAAAPSSPIPAATSRTCCARRSTRTRPTLLIDRILQNGDISGIEGLKWMDAASIGEMLRHEHPQIVAAVLVHLDTDQAAGGAEDLRRARSGTRCCVRIATLDGIQPSALKDLSRGHGAHGHRRRAGAHGAARRRQDRGRDDQPDGHRDRDRGARLHPRSRQRPGAARSWTTCSPSTT